jgi:hypothetical protein
MIRSIGESAPKKRAVADAMADEKTKKMMLRIADDYETMAKRAEQRLSDQNSIAGERGVSQTAAKPVGKPLERTWCRARMSKAIYATAT